MVARIRQILPLPLLIGLLMLVTGPTHADNPANRGLIYATITWPGGESQEGYLRWENEEATWDDLFHTGYRENPWSDHIDHETLKKEKRDKFYAEHGLLKRLVYALHEDDEAEVGWRMLEIRFGDIQRFEIRAGKDDFVTTVDGGRHQVGGYANDNGSDLWFYEKGEEPLEIEWNDLIGIEFQAAPDDHEPFARRLNGTVETSEGSFTGPIMWDKSECLDIDRLDGENASGDLSLPMGEIRSITKVDKNSVEIETTEGDRFTMWGSNDVDAGNRGIWILTPDQGWVDVAWKRFQRVTFSDEVDSGRPLSAFDNAAPLRGTVGLEDGTRLTGRLVYDLDEGFAWDIFNGKHRDIAYDIPFSLITRIERLPEASCRVHLRSGQILELAENQDTGKEHGGILVFAEGVKPVRHIPWRLVREVVFTP